MLSFINTTLQESLKGVGMEHSYPLGWSVRLLRVLIPLNWIAGVLIFLLLVASVVAEEAVMSALGAGPAEGNAERIAGMRQIAVLGIVAVLVTHVVLSRLRGMVGTVRDGDPFVAENAARLRTIAWSVLGLELLHLLVGVVAALATSETAPLDIDWNFSLSRWLSVLLLFVLAQVFEEGARMREELEGTV
jgi:hypothetical protein